MESRNSLKNINIAMLLDNNFVSDARVEKEAASLIKFGAEVTVYCTKDEKCADSENRRGVQIFRIFEEAYNAPLRRGYTKFIKRHAKNIAAKEYNAIHCHDFHMLSIGVEIKKISPHIVLIYDAHEYLKGWPYYQTATSIKNRLKGKIVWNKLLKKERKEIMYADFVLTVSDAISKRLHKNYHLNDMPIVLNNFPYKIKLKTSHKYFHHKFKIDLNQLILIHSGTIYHTDEQLEHLFSIVTKIPILKLIFIGNRPRFFEVKEKVSKDSLLKSNIFFHDYFPKQEDNINLISCGDIGLLHIRDKWEAHRITFSNRFVEYIAAGLPVVGTPQEFAVHLNESFNCCQFYHENNSSELNSGINNILANLEKYSKNAMIAKESLSWEKETTKLLELYRTLLNK